MPEGIVHKQFINLKTTKMSYEKIFHRWFNNNQRSYDNEVNFYKKSKAFKCKCGHGGHFPKLLAWNSKDKAIIISHVGTAIKELKEVPRIDDLEAQIDCILDSFESIDFYHLEPHNRNICFKNGTIYVIDFEISCYGGRTEGPYAKWRNRRNNTFSDFRRNFKEKVMGHFGC